MKSRADLVRGWLRKAESDRTAIAALIHANSLDTACFHAQQAVEKYLKAYLIERDQSFAFTHNLSKLLAQCVACDPAFAQLDDVVAPLTPFAVELRYDAQFWPAPTVARDAQAAVDTVRNFMRARMSSELRVHEKTET